GLPSLFGRSRTSSSKTGVIGESSSSADSQWRKSTCIVNSFSLITIVVLSPFPTGQNTNPFFGSFFMLSFILQLLLTQPRDRPQRHQFISLWLVTGDQTVSAAENDFYT